MNTDKVGALREYLRYAEEIKANNMMVSYGCYMHYVKKMIELTKQDPKSSNSVQLAEIVSITNKAKDLKKAINKPNEQVGKDIEQFISNLFNENSKGVNPEEQVNEKDLNECKKICDLIEILEEFNIMSNDWRDKRNYCLSKISYLQSFISVPAPKITLKCDANLFATTSNIKQIQTNNVTPNINSEDSGKFKPSSLVLPESSPVKTKQIETKKISKYDAEYYSSIEKATKEIETSINILQHKNKCSGRESIIKAIQLLDALAD